MNDKVYLQGYLRSLIYLLFLIALLLVEFKYSEEMLVFALLMLPATDREWLKRASIQFSRIEILLFVLAVAMVFFAIPVQRDFVVSNLVYAAIPEEWYFRAYLIGKYGFNIWSNLLSAIYFSILHSVEYGFAKGFYVFVPSLIFGWLYIKTRSLLLIIFTHLVSNLVYVEYVH